MLKNWAKFAGFSAILAFFLTGSFLFALQPSVKIHKRSSQTEEQPYSPPQTFSGWRILLPGQLEAISEFCNSYPETEKKKWPEAYYCDIKITDTYIAFFTALLFLVTGGLVLVTGGLVVVGYRQETMARTHERAYVFGGGPVQVMKRGVVVPDLGTMSIENYGRTPATVGKIEWGLCDESKFPKDIPVSRIIEGNLLPDGIIQILSVQNVLPPNMPPMIFTDKIEFSHSENLGKIFFGRFNYKDVFGDEHYSTFKLRLTETGSEGLEGRYTDWK